ncbi:Palmitoyltransferase ZDHHC13 [Bagarius yarrelli]|uniref:Palmitoyltransferase n=1 Tax=Bagarius yarrelli TaxID=175774 RepID=A0A556U322_BAGYA|nr:Palmitoyltransferase ZDHHC13 [Bagarius yarrelli]
MAYQLYRNTTLGNSLQESLDELIQTQQITPQLALQVLLQFDKAINNALANRVRNRVNFKGSLNTYRFCDNVWTFVLNDVEFREVTDLVKVDKVKIVACDGKTRELENPNVVIMDWNKEVSAGHGHSHGPDGQRCHGTHGVHGGHSHGFMPNFQLMQRSEVLLDPTQQPKKYTPVEDSSSWDIVKATQFGAFDRCKELIEAGYDVRQPDKENVTLLHWAAINNRADLLKQGHLQIVIQLMRYGADPSLVDGEGYGSLHLAVLFQHMPIAAYLMAKGQEVDAPDANGQTPLMLAAQKIIGPEPTNFLLRCNASVNVVDKVNRNSPLHCAVLAGNVDAAHILLEAGANLELQNTNNIVVLAEAGFLDPRIFCTSCMMRKPMRAHHCFSCNSCIAKQDHHSLWINGCIGARNHHYFVLFLMMLNLMCVWMLYSCVIYWSQRCMSRAPAGLWDTITNLITCSPWITYICVIALLHTVWASITLAQQLYQVAFLGLTTAERASLLHGHRKLPQTFSLRQNPFNQGVLKNLVNFFQLRCCGLFKPLVLDWTQELPVGLNRDHQMFGNLDAV